MPTKRAIAWAELKVGVLIITALVILSAIIILVLGVESPFAPRYTIYTYLPNIGGLRPDTPVMLEGVTIGEVKEFEFAEIGKGVRITMRIQKKFQDRIRTDSIAKLQSLGLLGDKYIEITQGTLNGRVLKEGEAITGAPPLDLDQMIAKATHSFDNFSETVDNIKVLTQGLRQGEGTVGKLLRDEQVYKNLNETLLRFHSGKGTIAQLLNNDALYKDLDGAVSNLRTVLARVEKGQGGVGKLLSDPQVEKSVENSVKKLEEILARMNKGEGSLGKLSVDPALYNNLNKIAANLAPLSEKMQKGEGTIGQLFYDKQLYDNSNKLVSELVMLVHDIREDPKKYLRVRFSIF
jgi:phospholipid/cholesterol/gamma-HCH transport system substrate-binding protein